MSQYINKSIQSETLKYLYLLFSDETVLPFDRKLGQTQSSIFSLADRSVQAMCSIRKRTLCLSLLTLTCDQYPSVHAEYIFFVMHAS